MNRQQLRLGVVYLGNNLKNKEMTFIEELQKRQNDKNNIKRLAAQRRIYSKATDCYVSTNYNSQSGFSAKSKFNVALSCLYCIYGFPTIFFNNPY